MAAKSVYFFGGGRAEGHGAMKELLGGKGAGLMEMTRIGLPVPAGFVITTATCARYMKEGRKALRGIEREVRTHLRRVLQKTGTDRQATLTRLLLTSLASLQLTDP